MSPEDLAETIRLNAVVAEDEHLVTLRPVCPTAAHRPEKVPAFYAVRFRCPHNESVSAFCVPCTADRRAGRFACGGEHLLDEQCPGSYAVEVWPVLGRTFIKDH